MRDRVENQDCRDRVIEAVLFQAEQQGGALLSRIPTLLEFGDPDGENRCFENGAYEGNGEGGTYVGRQ